MNHHFGGGASGYTFRHKAWVDSDLSDFVDSVERSLAAGAPVSGGTARPASEIEEPTRRAGRRRYTRPLEQAVLPFVVVVAAGRNARLLYTRTGSSSPELPRLTASALAAVLNPTVNRPLRRDTQ